MRMRKYLNIVVHGNDNESINLGLIRIFNSCSATQLVEKVEHHLNLFNLDFKNHIVGSTSDGASLMVKFGKESPVIFTLCLNHTIHLAVCDILYKKKQSGIQNEENVQNSEYEEDDGSENDTVEDFSEENDDDEAEEKDEFELTQLCEVYCNIEGVRKITKYFKKSTVRNNILQEHIKITRGTELQLVLEVKTRWNSLLDMITVFLNVFPDIKEALKDIGNLNLLENINIPLLEELQKCLKPIKLTVDVLSRDNANLSTGRLAINFMLEKLQELNSTLSKEILTTMQVRLNSRKNNNLDQLLESLTKGTMPSKQILLYASDLGKRLFDDNKDFPLDSMEQPSTSTASDNVSVITMEEELDNLLKHADFPIPTSYADNLGTLKREFLLFNNSKRRTQFLDKLYNALLTIKPTSTNAERTFSVATNFCTKIRSRLSDQSLNAF